MTLFADILLAALTVVAPENGATVPVLSPVHRGYLEESMESRFADMAKPDVRRSLVSAGFRQPPLKLEWKGGGEMVRLEIRRSGDETAQVFSLTNTGRAFITNLEVAREYSWKVSSGDEQASGGFRTESEGPRLMTVDGVRNIRDLGGWRTVDGRRVKQNRVFRSAALRASSRAKGGGDSLVGGAVLPGSLNITDAGISVMRDELRIRTDIELRTQREAACMEKSALGDDIVFVKQAFGAYDFIDRIVRGREPFARIFRVFADPGSYPVVFHCSGGRDRTGTLAFLLLGLLGVSEDDLCRDWEASMFCNPELDFGPDRIHRLLGYLRGFGGKDLREDCELYARGCGITDEQLAAFRSAMLEEEVRK